MKRNLSRRIALLSFVCIAIVSFALYSPMVCHGEEYDLEFDFSPNIINIESERVGEIRILTRMAYSFFIANKAGEPLFIYFNDCDESVENIRPSRDSLGNLILRFSLEDLLNVQNCLDSDAYNEAIVVITMENGDEYIGEGEVYISGKQQGAR